MGSDQDQRRTSPRVEFARRFSELFDAAGNPTLRRVAVAAQARMRAGRAPGQKGGVPIQRISDWRAGRNVPARFDSLLPVLLTLVEEARKSSRPAPPALLDVQEWKRLWTAANDWDPESDAAECPYPGLTSYGRRDADLFFGRSRPTAELVELIRRTRDGDGGIVVLVGASGAGKSSLLAAGVVPALVDREEEWAVATVTPGTDPIRALLEVAAGEAAVGQSAVGQSAVGEAVVGQLVAGEVDTGQSVAGEVGAGEAVVWEAGAGRAGVGDMAAGEPAAGPRAAEVTATGRVPGGETAAGETAVERTAARETVGGTAAGPAVGAAAGVTALGAVDMYDTVESVVVALSGWGAGRRRLLIVDQFEELFTVCRDDRGRTSFLAVLEHLAIRGECAPVAVVLAVRADFYARCLDVPVLEDALKHRSYLLGPMRLDELAEAIVKPAEAVGYKLESGLEELVVTELCGLGGGGDRRSYDPGALPLVSHVMATVWRARNGTRLTVEGYRAAGGVLGSVAATAEAAWGELSEFERAVGKHVLLGLVAVGDDSRDTRRRVARAELVRDTVDAAETALEVLARTRLVTLDAEFAYLTHEIVLDAWPRMRGWIDEDRVGYLERQRLQADATDWAANGRDPSMLYRGARLITVRTHAERGNLGTVAAEFLGAAVLSARSAERRSTVTKSALALLGVAVLVLAGVAFVQSGTARQERDAAVFAAVLAESDRLETADPSLSAQFAAAAYRMRPGDSEAVARMVNTENAALATPLAGHEGFVYDTAYRSDGKLVATGGLDRTVRLWDVTDRRAPVAVGAPMTGHTDFVVDVEFSPDGTVLASAAADDTVRLWDVRDPAAPRPLGAPLKAGYATAVGFSADGRTLASSGPNAAVMLWDIGDPERPIVIGTPLGEVSGRDIPSLVVFGADLRAIVVIGMETTTLWSLPDPRGRAVPVARLSDQAVSAAFGPDGALAVAERESVQLWTVRDLAAPKKIGEPIDYGPAVVGAALAFSPDGRMLAAESERGAIALWNIADVDAPVAEGSGLRGSAGALGAVAFAPDGRSILTSGMDGLLRVWSLPDTRAPRLSRSERSRWNHSPRFDASGRVMTVVAGDRWQVWEVADGRDVRLLGDFPIGEGYVEWALSPDGRTAVVGVDGRALLLDLTYPAAIRQAAELPPDLVGRLDAVAFDPTSRYLVTGGSVLSDGVRGRGDLVGIWDVSNPVAPRRVGSIPSRAEDLVTGIAFGAGGSRVAVARLKAPTTLWDIDDPSAPRPRGSIATSPNSSWMMMAWSPRADVIVTAGDDQTVRVWNVADPDAPTAVGRPLTGHTAFVAALSFSADGRTLASAGRDAVRLWDFSDPSAPAPIRHPAVSYATPPTTMSVTFHPDGRRLFGVGAGGDPHIWSLDPESALTRICDVTRSIMTPQVWRDHLPGIAYDPACP